MIKQVLLVLLSAFIISGTEVFASGLFVRIEQPKSPTNQNKFTINFVALDTENRQMTATCLIKGPRESEFKQFGQSFSLVSGGSGNCPVDISQININGEYQFLVKVSTGEETVQSSEVGVVYDDTLPGTPVNYLKEKVDECQFKINFKTADDSGKTKIVNLYRSDGVNFIADNTTKVDSLSVGSNEPGQFITRVRDCSKTYYFAIRAFNLAGSGSGLVGDTVTKVITQEIVVSPFPVNSNIKTGRTNSAGSSIESSNTSQNISGDVLGQAKEDNLESTMEPEIIETDLGQPLFY